VPSVSLPWWDWSSDQAHVSGIPEAYAADSVDGEPNPLYSVQIPEVARQQGSQLLQQESPAESFRRPGSPADLPTSEEVEVILQAPNFLDFSNRLEDLHGAIHIWIGGTTAEVPWAAYDPLFWAHHAMIDRLWRLWQLRNPETNLDPGLLREALPPFNMTVEDTLDVTALGYDYATSTRHVVTGGS
jgi:tyrosinase